jgi:hypothetical protein
MIRGIISINKECYECGNIKDSINNIYIYDFKSHNLLPALPELKSSPYVVFDNNIGAYILTFTVGKRYNINIYNQGLYPYQSIARLYGAATHLNKFEKALKQTYKINLLPKYTLAKYFPYTFGIEYETSIGAVPEDECYSKGLIPLRDGSITGVEYSTPVLKGNLGCHMIQQQINTLNKYTYFNKECALHIHFGGFPVEPQAILALNNLCSFLPRLVYNLVPSASFKTHCYKANGKDYCTPLQWSESFSNLYQHYVGQKYFGDLYQPHPADIEKKAKWNIKGRYKACNLINMLCYDSAKTVEFRFLRPTRNAHIIYFWLYTLNAILQYATQTKDLSLPDMYVLYDSITLLDIYTRVYPKDIVDQLMVAVNDLTIIRTNQSNNGDICGADIIFEENFKLSNNLIYG